MEILFIRHAMTQGNRERRYVGRTDEGLCPEGIALAQEVAPTLPEPELVYVSPMLRCRETAQLLFPGKELIVMDGLQETDFGKFEYKTYDELKEDEDYLDWLDSNGEGPIPGGESQAAVQQRVMKAFGEVLLDIMLRDYTERVALVVHGGTIMTILSALGAPQRDYYGWQVENCRGFIVTPEGQSLQVLGEL